MSRLSVSFRHTFLFAAISGCLLVAMGSVRAQDPVEGAEGAGTVQERIQQGIDLYNNADYEAAVQAFSEVIVALERATQYAPGPYVFRAKAYSELEEYEPALEDLKSALTYSQSSPQLMPEIFNTRAEIYIDVGAFQLALPDLQQAVQVDRSNPQYQFNLGKTLVSLGGAEPGEKALTKFLEAEVPEPTEDDQEQRAEAFRYRGIAYGSLRKNEKAEADFTASLAIDPEQHETYFARAQISLADKDYAAAIEDLHLAIENYTPDDEEDETPFLQGYLLIASCYEELGKESEDPGVSRVAYEKGLAECEELLGQLDEEDPTMAGARSAVQFRKGVLQRLLGDLGSAVTSFSQALQMNPVLGEAYFRRGVCFHYLGEEKLAIRDFEQAASIDFDSPRANLWKGLSWAQLGDFNEAIRAYGQSVAVSDRYTPAYVNRGLAHLRQADYEKAVDDFNEAIRLDPSNPLHYYRRGRSYSLAGDSDRAIQSLMNAIALDNRFAQAYAAAADELDATGQSALAAEYRRTAQQLSQ